MMNMQFKRRIKSDLQICTYYRTSIRTFNLLIAVTAFIVALSLVEHDIGIRGVTGRLSHAGNMSKLMTVGSCIFHCRVGLGLSVF